MKRLIIFTDLDGTLLDEKTYSFEKALPALSAIKEKAIPLVISSSKTKAEIELYRERLKNIHPFVVENGGGIYIPDGYFGFDLKVGDIPLEKDGGYHLIRLGARHEELRTVISKLKGSGLKIKGFGDMEVHEVAMITGLPMKEAHLAKDRAFDEPFILEDAEQVQEERLSKLIEASGFRVTKGRYYHLKGNSDKGRAIRILIELYKREFKEVYSVAIGDALNDLPMLEAVDCPILVKRQDGTYEDRIRLKNLVIAEGIGPEGWNIEILKVINRLFT